LTKGEDISNVYCQETYLECTTAISKCGAVEEPSIQGIIATGTLGLLVCIYLQNRSLQFPVDF